MGILNKYGVVRDLSGYKVLDYNTYSGANLKCEFFIQIELVKKHPIEFYRYTLTDKESNLFNLSTINWKCASIFESSKHYGVENNNNLSAIVQFEDIGGDMINLNVKGIHPNFLNGIVDKLNYLDKYHNANHFNLSLKVMELQKKIDKLDFHIERLKLKLKEHNIVDDTEDIFDV
jgi:hypothetical protein